MSKQIKMPSGLWITPTHKKNLETLAEGLLTLPDDAHFKMASFYDADSATKSREQAREAEHEPAMVVYDCGSSACAVGYAPMFGIKPRTSESWSEYASRVFGVGEERYMFSGITPLVKQRARDAFEFMFGGYWSNVDDTPRGAAARIKWFLSYGVPRDFLMMQDGSAPLVYMTNPELAPTMEVPQP